MASFAQQLPPEKFADYVSAGEQGEPAEGGTGSRPPWASPQCGHCRPGERFILDEWCTGLLTKAAASRPRSVLSPAGEALDWSLAAAGAAERTGPSLRVGVGLRATQLS